VTRGFLSEDHVERADLTDIAARVVRETDKAWLVNDGVREVWLPKSKAEKNSDGTFTLPDWLASEKGLI